MSSSTRERPDSPETARFASAPRILVVLIVLAVLAYLVTPQISDHPHNGQILQTTNNLRQVYLASYNMMNDGLEAKNPQLGWPGDLASSAENPVVTLAEFVERLVANDYMKRSDLGKMFAAPGVQIYQGNGPFESRHSAFKIYRVQESDKSECLFGATRNFTMGKDLDPKAVPYADKQFVIIRKGGDAEPYYNKQAAHRPLGFLPGQSSFDEARVETAESILKM